MTHAEIMKKFETSPASKALRARFARLQALGYDKWMIRNDPVYRALIGAEFRSIYGSMKEA